MGELGLFDWQSGLKNVSVIPEFVGLQAPNHLQNLTPLPHQLETAKQVIENMNGKAILADEV
ncbi:ATP-dependent helicase, partial [Neobacillus sp. 19]